MPQIRPFRGLHYNPRKIKELAKVVTEPYDVISRTQQADYYKLHPYNIIRLILGKRKSGDNNKDNRYARAGKYFTDWQRKEILVRQEKESIYILEQGFVHNNRSKTRTGFITLLKLADFGKDSVLPHENTNSSAVQDRLNLLKACGANLSPIFAMFCDPQRKVNKLLNQWKKGKSADIEIERDKVRHRLWRISDKRKIAALKKQVKDKQIFIADGHHRYEAALNYKVEMQKKRKRCARPDSFDYLMSYLVATTDPGLAILPTHRVLKVPCAILPQNILADLKKYFALRRFSTSESLFSYLGNRRICRFIFGAYFGKSKFYGLELKNAKMADRFIHKSMEAAHRGLDVAVLHKLIIEDILNLAPSEQDIYYTRDAQEAIKVVDTGKYQVVFFLKPATVTQVKKAAQAGEKMPHKSTYFYPKLLTGLVINKFNSTK